MICPTCEKEGLKSLVYVGPSSTTLMYSPPFYDEEGRFHQHDPNTTTTDYNCSNRHHWTSKSESKCWCGV